MAEADPDAPTSVLDASALLALIGDEEGAAVVEAALEGRAAISVVNWAEVLSKVAERGGDPIALEAEYRERGFVGEALAIEPLSEADCVEVARLRPLTAAQGLSLADRACLVLAMRLGVALLTTDRELAEAEVEVGMRLIR